MLSHQTRHFALGIFVLALPLLLAARCDNPSEPEVQTSRSDSEVLDDEKFLGTELESPASELKETPAPKSGVEKDEYVDPGVEESTGE